MQPLLLGYRVIEGNKRMNLVNMLTRRDPLKRAFVTLEDGMTDVLNEEFMLPPEPGSTAAEVAEQEMYGADLDPESLGDVRDDLAARPLDEPIDRITAHTQARLASHAAFDKARVTSAQELGRISEALASILANQNFTREFLNDCYADIHRANDLEKANAAYAIDNRRLNERVEKLEKLRTRYDQLIDVLKRRENKLIQDTETLREQLGALKLEVVEARNTLARNDSQLGELQAALAAKSAEAERFMRDSEVLRERNVGLTLDLDLAQKKQSETRRKFEDLTAVHGSDAARLAEVTGRLASEENETARLQKLSDALEAKLVEASDSVAQLTGELAERDKRYQSENHSLKNEIQSLHGRLQVATSEQRDAGVEVNDLRARLSDVESEKLILEKKFAALSNEFENERRLFIAQAGLPLQKDDGMAEQYRREGEKMRSEIAVLQETVSQLRQYETVYSAAKVRAKARTEVADTFTISNGKVVPEFSPPAPIVRRA